MKKIVVASDSFKGSLSSAQVAEEVEKGIHSVFPDCIVVKLSVADGGEGTVEALVDTLKGHIVKVRANDPLMRPIQVSYGIVGEKNVLDKGYGEGDVGGKTAVIEMAAASGLPLLTPEERNPWLTSTYGTGELIMDALRRGCRKILVGIGGSATNDAGTGMLAALGYRFLDVRGEELTPCGGVLGSIASVDDSSVPAAVKEAQFIVACDVDTPFCGPAGAAHIFARQKGADEEMVLRLDEGLSSFATVIEKDWKSTENFRMIPGTGAAGGLGGGFLAFLDARLEKGVDMVLDAIGFDEQIRGAQLVITGEGKIDSQTFKGKTPYGVMLRAASQQIPTIAIGGAVELPEMEKSQENRPDFLGVYPIVSGPLSLEEAMRPDVAALNIRTAVAAVMDQLFLSKKF